MGLDRLGEDLVAALATAAGVHAPAPPGTLAEEKQASSSLMATLDLASLACDS